MVDGAETSSRRPKIRAPSPRPCLQGEALVEPFSRCTPRAAAPVGWEEILCIQIDGITLPEGCPGLRTSSSARRSSSCSHRSAADAARRVCRGRARRRRGYAARCGNPPPPPMTTAHTSANGHGQCRRRQPPDADTLRRATNAFEAISGGGAAVSGARTHGAAHRPVRPRALLS